MGRKTVVGYVAGSSPSPETTWALPQDWAYQVPWLRPGWPTLSASLSGDEQARRVDEGSKASLPEVLPRFY